MNTNDKKNLIEVIEKLQVALGGDEIVAVCGVPMKVINKILDPGDVIKLPWKGNAYSDQNNFDLCHAFIMDATNSWDDRVKVLSSMGQVGMGLDDICTDDDLRAYLNEAPENE